MVQGVGYRFFVFRQARRLQLAGWVRNLPSGEVEIRVEGPRGMIESLIRDLWTGNPSAAVRNVEVAWSAFSGRFKRFDVMQ
jgi:acylphosphatase